VIDFSSVICITYYSGPLGKTKHFNLHLDKLDVAADLVIDVTKKNYPDFNIPYHSRWRHFKKGSVEELSAHWPCGQKVRILVFVHRPGIVLTCFMFSMAIRKKLVV